MEKDTAGKSQTAGQMRQPGAIPADGMAPEVEGHLQGQAMTSEGTTPEVEGHGKLLKGTEQPAAAQDQGPEVEGHGIRP